MNQTDLAAFFLVGASKISKVSKSQHEFHLTRGRNLDCQRARLQLFSSSCYVIPWKTIPEQSRRLSTKLLWLLSPLNKRDTICCTICVCSELLITIKLMFAKPDKIARAVVAKSLSAASKSIALSRHQANTVTALARRRESLEIWNHAG